MRTLNEVSVFLSGKQFRRFFVSILLNGNVEDPAKIWEDFKEKLSDDFRGQDKERNIRRALYHIHKLLQWRGRSLAEFGLGGGISDEEIARMDNYQREEDERFEVVPNIIDNRVCFTVETRKFVLGPLGNRRKHGRQLQRGPTTGLRRDHDCYYERQ